MGYILMYIYKLGHRGGSYMRNFPNATLPTNKTLHGAALSSSSDLFSVCGGARGGGVDYLDISVMWDMDIETYFSPAIPRVLRWALQELKGERRLGKR